MSGMKPPMTTTRSTSTSTTVSDDKRMSNEDDALISQCNSESNMSKGDTSSSNNNIQYTHSSNSLLRSFSRSLSLQFVSDSYLADSDSESDDEDNILDTGLHQKQLQDIQLYVARDSPKMKASLKQIDSNDSVHDSHGSCSNSNSDNDSDSDSESEDSEVDSSQSEGDDDLSESSSSNLSNQWESSSSSSSHDNHYQLDESMVNHLIDSDDESERNLDLLAYSTSLENTTNLQLHSNHNSPINQQHIQSNHHSFTSVQHEVEPQMQIRMRHTSNNQNILNYSPIHTNTNTNTNIAQRKHGGYNRMPSPSFSPSRSKNIKKYSTTLYRKIYQSLRSRSKSTLLLLFTILLWSYIRFQIYILQKSSSTSPYNTATSTNTKNSFFRKTQQHQPPNPKAFMTDEELNEYISSQRLKNEQEAIKALGNGAGSLYQNNNKNGYIITNSNKNKHQDVDKLPKGCIPISWHNDHYPTCNNLHELDLKQIMRIEKNGPKIPADLGETLWNGGQYVWDKRDQLISRTKFGYMGSGMWRQVWSVMEDISLSSSSTSSSLGLSSYPLSTNNSNTNISTNYTMNLKMTPIAALKMMKMEHPINIRNFDRHRRDALVMERMTWSPNVISIYGFCGNTVLTEYVGLTLDDIIYHKNINSFKRQQYHNRQKEQSPADQQEQQQQQQLVNDEHEKEVDIEIESSEDLKVDNIFSQTYEDLIKTYQTPEGKLLLALHVMRGLKAIHDIQDGPILHADLQAKQLLIDHTSTNKNGGIVKLNDFNRCRFLPRKENDVNQICKIKIPSAPGMYRSPEEYEQSKLDEKIDIYSAGNILYGILTGKEAWDVSRHSMNVQKNIATGKRPVIDDKFRQEGTLEKELSDIVDNMYQQDPDKRWSAKQIVSKLERLLKLDESSSSSTTTEFNQIQDMKTGLTKPQRKSQSSLRK